MKGTTQTERERNAAAIEFAYGLPSYCSFWVLIKIGGEAKPAWHSDEVVENEKALKDENRSRNGGGAESEQLPAPLCPVMAVSRTGIADRFSDT